MKKLIPLLVAALVLLIASPAFAANLKVTGSFDGSAGYDQREDFDDQGLFYKSKLGLGVEAQLSENLKAVVGMKVPMDDMDLTNGWSWNDAIMAIDKAYVESTGSLIPGLPGMTTRLGTQEIGYSSMNGVVTAEGIGVSGLTLGPVSLSGFQAWDGHNVTDPITEEVTRVPDQVRGAQVYVNPMNGLAISANVIHAVDELSGTVEGTVKPFEPLTINAGFGYLHGDTPAMAVRGGVDYAVLPFMTLHAGARKIDTGFTPVYSEKDDDGLQVVAEDTIGFNGGVTVNALGATIDTNVDRAAAISTSNVKYTGDLMVERPFTVAGMTFAPKYELTLVKDGAAEMAIDEQVVSLGYKAPNNITLTGGVDLTDMNNVQPFVSAQMAVSF